MTKRKKIWHKGSREVKMRSWRFGSCWTHSSGSLWISFQLVVNITNIFLKIFFSQELLLHFDTDLRLIIDGFTWNIVLRLDKADHCYLIDLDSFMRNPLKTKIIDR